MIEILLTLALSLAGAVCADRYARPTPSKSGLALRRAPAIWLLSLISASIFGILLAASGNPYLALILSLALHVLLVSASNAKYRMLGEPLLFSDLALIGAIFRHPQFYFSVLTIWQKGLGLIALAALAAVLYWFFVPSLIMGVAGLTLALSAFAILLLSLRLRPFSNLATRPAVEKDTCEFGLLPIILLYWLRWRVEKAVSEKRLGAGALPEGIPLATAEQARIIIVVQCESFADPVELFGGNADTLVHLGRSRRDGLIWGNLLASGFGAYTMRTEYGVLFGRGEEELGFRMYDPYLTAIADVDHAIPNKLRMNGWRSVFVHPHDMRFYNRHTLLPKAGFTDLVGENHFEAPPSGPGRYVKDAAVAEKIIEIARAAEAPTFIYAVTMENHGPWARHGGADPQQMIANYNRLVKAGDSMLGRLREGVASLGQPALLAFFGDHRPSIPGASEPGGPRHTPFVMIQFDAQGRITGQPNARLDLTPAQLHHAIVELTQGSTIVRD